MWVGTCSGTESLGITSTGLFIYQLPDVSKIRFSTKYCSNSVTLHQLSTWSCPHLLQWHCCWVPAPAIIQYLLPTGHSTVKPLHTSTTAAVDWKERQSVRLWMPCCFINPALHTVWALSITKLCNLHKTWGTTTAVTDGPKWWAMGIQLVHQDQLASTALTKSETWWTGDPTQMHLHYFSNEWVAIYSLVFSWSWSQEL